MDIRVAEAADAAGIQAVYAPVVNETSISFETEPPTVAEMARRIGATLPGHPWLVLEDGGRILGYAYAHAFAGRPAYRFSVETSVYVDAGARGRGAGRALYTALIGVLRAQGYRQALAGIALPNPASVALHESLGFQPVGVYRRVGWKLGAWHDVGWWQVVLSPEDGPPVPPVPVDRLDPEALGAATEGGWHVR